MGPSLAPVASQSQACGSLVRVYTNISKAHARVKSVGHKIGDFL